MLFVYKGMYISSVGQYEEERQMSIVVDRSQGASSLVDGTAEIMVHR